MLDRDVRRSRRLRSKEARLSVSCPLESSRAGSAQELLTNGADSGLNPKAETLDH